LDPTRDSKSGRITLKMRVVGPRNHADDLVENLERSKHFLQPHIVDESTESNSNANQRLEPVSASNRFTFEILAEYNAAAEEDIRAEKRLVERMQSAETKPEKKAQPAAGRPGQSLPKPMPQQIVHPMPVPLVPGANHSQFSPSGPQKPRPMGNPVPVPIPNAGGPR
jgi:type IV pilus assembly protein PilN